MRESGEPRGQHIVGAQEVSSLLGFSWAKILFAFLSLRLDRLSVRVFDGRRITVTGSSGHVNSRDQRAQVGWVRVWARGRAWTLLWERTILTWELSAWRGGEEGPPGCSPTSAASPCSGAEFVLPHQASRLGKYFYLTRSNYLPGSLERTSTNVQKLSNFRKPFGFFTETYFFSKPIL